MHFLISDGQFRNPDEVDWWSPGRLGGQVCYANPDLTRVFLFQETENGDKAAIAEINGPGFEDGRTGEIAQLVKSGTEFPMFLAEDGFVRQGGRAIWDGQEWTFLPPPATRVVASHWSPSCPLDHRDGRET